MRHSACLSRAVPALFVAATISAQVVNWEAATTGLPVDAGPVAMGGRDSEVVGIFQWPEQDQQFGFWTAARGVFRSTNGGQSWTELPNAPGGEVIYVGNGVMLVGQDSSQQPLSRSTDGGATWSLAPGIPAVGRVTVIEEIGADLYCTFNRVNAGFPPTVAGDLYRSADNGASWTRLPDTDLPDLPHYALASPDGGSHLFVTTQSASMTVYRSTDGESWAAVPGTSLNDTNVSLVGLDGIVYGRGTESAVNGVWFTDDLGDSWQFSGLDYFTLGRMATGDVAVFIAGYSGFSAPYTPQLSMTLDHAASWLSIPVENTSQTQPYFLERVGDYLFIGLQGAYDSTIFQTRKTLYRAAVSALENLVFPPESVTVPRSAAGNPGSTVTLTATPVRGTPPFHYQWFKGETPIPDATSPTLTLTDFSETSAGAYHVEVANDGGTTPSTNIDVSFFPAAVGYPDITFNAGGPTLDLASVTALARRGTQTLIGTAVVSPGALRLLEADGGFDGQWQTTAYPNGAVTVIAVDAGGQIFVGYNGNGWVAATDVSPYLTRVRPDGLPDPEFKVDEGNGSFNINAANKVRTIAWQSDGKILIGGTFVLTDGLFHVLRLLPDGRVDPSFERLSHAGEVYAIQVLADDSFWVAGDSAANGTQGWAFDALGRYHPDGSADDSFTSPFTNGSTAVDMATDGDGNLYLVGLLTRETIGRIRRVVKLTPAGVIDTSFGNETDTSDKSIDDVAIQADGKVLISGAFTYYANGPHWGMVRLTAAGAVDTTFANGEHLNHNGLARTVADLLLQPDGGILVAGNFDAFDGFRSGGLLRLIGDTPPPVITVTPSAVTYPVFRAPLLPADLLAGVSAVDYLGTVITDDIVTGGDAVLVDVPGDYVVTYDVQDSGGTASATRTRTYHIVDRVPPHITVTPQLVDLATADPLLPAVLTGVSASDDVDGDLTAAVVVTSDAFSTATPGDYKVRYQAADLSGNLGFGSRLYRVRNAPTTDTDSDGVDDQWEIDNFGDLRWLGSDDADGDGENLLTEFGLDRDPFGYELSLRPGWNLVSLSRLPSSAAVADVLVDDGQPVVIGDAWQWDANTRTFRATDALSAWTAAWVYVKRAATVTVAVPHQPAPAPPALEAGDLDADGLDDDWERQYFGDLRFLAADDPDSDGDDNGTEFIGGSNPLGFAVALLEGWNLVSLPQAPVTRPVDQLGLSAYPAWTWDPERQAVVFAGLLDAASGVWLWSDVDRLGQNALSVALP